MSKSNKNESNAIKIPINLFEDFQLRLSLEKQYRTRYNELANKISSLQALSILSNLRIELERKCEKEKEEVLDEVEFVKTKFKRLHNENAISKELKEIFEMLDDYFSFDIELHHEIINREELLEVVQDYYDKNDFEHFSRFRQEIDNYFYYKRETDRRIVHLNVVEELIDRVIEWDYPESLPEATDEEKVKRKRKKPGRKTPEKLLDDIQEILTEAIKLDAMFSTNNKLVINRVLEFAMKNPMFYKRWLGGNIK